jgi:hypothetical protein
MTKDNLANNINTRIQAINPMSPGMNVGQMVSTIIAEEVDAYVKDMTVTVTVPALAVTNNSTSEVQLTATIQAI